MAHSALGIVALKTADDAAAEKELKLSADLNQSQPDPYIWYHLALAQDHQKKYSEALASINRALQVMGANADLGNLAKGEQSRLLTLTGGASK
jgi:tetratricopeptide (TPR) repeat protein